MPDLKQKPLIEILIIAVVLLAIGEGYIIYTLSHQSSRNLSPAGAAAGASSAQSKVPVISNVLVPTGGEVSRVEGSAVVLKQLGGISERSIKVDGNTSIMFRGALKDQKTQDAEMQAFHDESNKLAADPKVNEHALRRLVAPSTYQETKIALSDIKPGDTVSVFLDGDTAASIEVLMHKRQ